MSNREKTEIKNCMVMPDSVDIEHVVEKQEEILSGVGMEVELIVLDKTANLLGIMVRECDDNNQVIKIVVDRIVEHVKK